MAEQNKDERLIQLMTEFLQTTNEDADHSVVRKAHPELDNATTQSMIKNLTDEVELFKSQLQDVRKKVLNQSQRENYKSDGLELNSVQNSISGQSTKIGDLEYKVNMLKADLDKKKEPKQKTGFGLLGWGLLASNLLLWAMLGWFMWIHKPSDPSGDSSKKALASKGSSELSKQKNTLNGGVALGDKVRGLPREESAKNNVADKEAATGVIGNKNTHQSNITESTKRVPVSEGVKNPKITKTASTVANSTGASGLLEKSKLVSQSKLEQLSKKTVAKKELPLHRKAQVVQKTITAKRNRVHKKKNPITAKSTVAKRVKKAKVATASTVRKKSKYVPPNQREPQVRFGD